MDRVPAIEQLSQRRIRILMVEDSEDDAFLLYSELAVRGANVGYRRVCRPLEMAAALKSEDWDIILCDHSMPGFDAFGALEVLKASGKDIPFIIYSGQIADPVGHRAMAAGVQDFIPKGDIGRLMPVLERELRGAAARDAARRADQRIRRLAFYDCLSSLPNQNLLRGRINDWMSEWAQRGRAACGALLHIDIDRFLRINGSFGYEAGNEILRQAAARLNDCVAESGVVARLGGDEFGIFYPQVSGREQAEPRAREIVEAFRAPFYKGSLELYLSASVGAALAPADGADAYELMTNAETAMRVAKRAGGNGFRCYGREMNASSAERLALEMDLRRAVDREELLAHYQPIVSAATGRPVSVEVLLRWVHPRHGVIQPDRFIPIADESGLIGEIGEWALGQACREAGRWSDLGAGTLNVSVNVSAVQFSQPRLLEVVRRTLAESGIDPQRLELEITESVLMREAETTIGMLRALKNMGVRISVDDFGTGYSSLAYLKRFPIDILKIDRVFVRDLAVSEDDAAIVRTIMALSRSLRLETVAEGVESAEQLRFLKEEGCGRFQGYYFSPGLAAEDFRARFLAPRGGAAPALH
ncbi:MAG: hypothetical protein Fur0039_20570 [Rhodocyclaceae bacterium]